MKLTKSKLNKLIKEEMQHLNEQDPNAIALISAGYGDIMNLLRGRGEWEKVLPNCDCRESVGQAIGPHLQKILKGIIALKKRG